MFSNPEFFEDLRVVIDIFFKFIASSPTMLFFTGLVLKGGEASLAPSSIVGYETFQVCAS